MSESWKLVRIVRRLIKMPRHADGLTGPYAFHHTSDPDLAPDI